MAKRFRILGTIKERETGRPLSRLIVRAFDKDLLQNDKLGFATTDEDGRFEIRFGEAVFRDILEKRPDIFLEVYDPSGERLLHDTSDAVRRNATDHEEFRIAISGSELVPSRP